jgi:hypothetical protein
MSESEQEDEDEGELDEDQDGIPISAEQRRQLDKTIEPPPVLAAKVTKQKLWGQDVF